MLWIGLILLVVAGILAWRIRRSNARLESLQRTETVTIGDLRAMQQAAAAAAGPGHFRHTCEVIGTAQPHRNGLLTSQLNKVECVWHRHKITRRYEERRRDGNGRTRRTTRNETVAQHRSNTAFFVEGDGGKVVIRPEGAEIVGAAKPLDVFRPHEGGRKTVSIGPISFTGGGDGTIGYKHEEWVLRAGTRLFVHGEANDANGYLEIGRPAENGEFIVSGKQEQELVRSGNRELKITAVACGLCALGGVALTIAGLVL
ncbi:E3 ubiquitin ligase [Murinocardiopsis flavida]|uniref:RING-type E3 ubiquitin transferase n=1 Tax=Murinocardiopsis flavida TaxID=645275 RepID=A0A2P8CPP1_9ACTN|nr:GIDE domain-containing protein [Murinocardiopsis flavida]PSK86924.1 E3 ubiquitin ligase [Murinocardiopsis flavida]